MKIPRFTFRSWLVGLGAVLVLGAGALLYVYYLHVSLKAELRTYLTAVAQQNVKILNIQMDGTLKTLQSVAAALAVDEDFEAPRRDALLRAETQQNGFKRMGLVQPNGVASLSDGLLINLAGQAHFEKALTGVAAVSDVIADSVDREKIIVQAVPVQVGQEVRGVLFATRPVAAYNNLLLADSFNGQGYSLVVKANGEKVMASRGADADPTVSNIFKTALNKNLDRSGMMRRNMREGKSGTERFYRAGQGWLYVSYRPVGINDWYLLSVVPARVAVQKTRNLLFLSLILCGTGFLVFAALLGYIYWQNVKNSRELYKIAYTDIVTKGPNWQKVYQQTQQLLKDDPDARYAFVIFDINKFKLVNDLYGYPKGNELLRYIYKMAQESMREGETFSRVQADVFQMLLRYKTPEELKNRLERLNEQMVYAVSAAGKYQLILSFGVYLAGDERLTPDEMMFRASLACNSVKGKYSDIVAFYSEDLRRGLSLEQQIENEMEDALHSAELRVRLAPVCDTEGRLVSAEVRPCWMREGKEWVTAEAFLPVFERNGFISRLDKLMAQEAFKILQQWRKEGISGVALELNVSVWTLNSPYFPAVLRQMAAQYEVSPADLTLLLSTKTERAQLPLLCSMGELLHKEGFPIGLSGFASGNVSLELIKKLPVNQVKMEGSFLKDLEKDERARQILSALIALVKTLGACTIWEGVSTQQEWERLRALGACFYQGPLAGQAVSAAELMQQLPRAKENPPA